MYFLPLNVGSPPFAACFLLVKTKENNEENKNGLFAMNNTMHFKEYMMKMVDKQSFTTDNICLRVPNAFMYNFNLNLWKLKTDT